MPTTNSVNNKDLLNEGYQTWGAVDAFEDMIGPFFYKKMDGGEYVSAFVSEERHLNGGGKLHGGLLMSFADFAMFVIAKDHLEGAAVTVGFNSEFVSAGEVGERIEASGEVTKATGSMLFVRGKIFSGDTTILTFSGILKKIRRR